MSTTGAHSEYTLEVEAAVRLAISDGFGTFSEVCLRTDGSVLRRLSRRRRLLTLDPRAVLPHRCVVRGNAGQGLATRSWVPGGVASDPAAVRFLGTSSHELDPHAWLPLAKKADWRLLQK
jgi:hypothetical protein